MRIQSLVCLTHMALSSKEGLIWIRHSGNAQALCLARRWQGWAGEELLEWVSNIDIT